MCQPMKREMHNVFVECPFCWEQFLVSFELGNWPFGVVCIRCSRLIDFKSCDEE